MSKEMELSYGKKNEAGEVVDIGTVVLKVPETLDEARSMWGEEVVLSKAVASVVIDAQRIARSADTPDKAQEHLNSWAPGVSRERASGMSMTALAKKFKALGPEKIKELLASAGIDLKKTTA